MNEIDSDSKLFFIGADSSHIHHSPPHSTTVDPTKLQATLPHCLLPIFIPHRPQPSISCFPIFLDQLTECSNQVVVVWALHLIHLLAPAGNYTCYTHLYSTSRQSFRSTLNALYMSDLTLHRYWYIWFWLCGQCMK